VFNLAQFIEAPGSYPGASTINNINSSIFCQVIDLKSLCNKKT